MIINIQDNGQRKKKRKMKQRKRELQDDCQMLPGEFVCVFGMVVSVGVCECVRLCTKLEGEIKQGCAFPS